MTLCSEICLAGQGLEALNVILLLDAALLVWRVSGATMNSHVVDLACIAVLLQQNVLQRLDLLLGQIDLVKVDFLF